MPAQTTTPATSGNAPLTTDCFEDHALYVNGTRTTSRMPRFPRSRGPGPQPLAQRTLQYNTVTPPMLHMRPRGKPRCPFVYYPTMMYVMTPYTKNLRGKPQTRTMPPITSLTARNTLVSERTPWPHRSLGGPRQLLELRKQRYPAMIMTSNLGYRRYKPSFNLSHLVGHKAKGSAGGYTLQQMSSTCRMRHHNSIHVRREREMLPDRYLGKAPRATMELMLGQTFLAPARHRRNQPQAKMTVETKETPRKAVYQNRGVNPQASRRSREQDCMNYFVLETLPENYHGG